MSKLIRQLMLGCLIVVPNTEVYATCYTVYDKSDKVVYRSENPPFDLSMSISQGLATKYPGGHLLQSEAYPCVFDSEPDTISKVNDGVRKRNSDPESRKISVVNNFSGEPDVNNAARIRSETNKSIEEDAFVKAKESVRSSKNCQFPYYISNDDEGEALAKAAKAECLNNEALTQVGKGDQRVFDARNKWKAHYDDQTQRRKSFREAIRDGQMQEKLDSLDRKMEKLDSLDRKMEKLDSLDRKTEKLDSLDRKIDDLTHKR